MEGFNFAHDAMDVVVDGLVGGMLGDKATNFVFDFVEGTYWHNSQKIGNNVKIY